MHIAAVFLTDGRPNIKHLGVSNDMGIENTETAANRLRGSDIHDKGNKPLGKTLDLIVQPTSLVFPLECFNAPLFEKSLCNFATVSRLL